MRIDAVLAFEAKRLHDLALAEFERRSGSWDDCDAMMKAGQLDKLRRLLRLLGRLRRWQRGILSRAGHEAGRGNVVTAAMLVAVYVIAL